MDSNRMIKARDMNFLLQELAVWQENAIVSQEQADQITGLYTVKRRSLVRVLLYAGATLVLLGGISLIAANWDDIPRTIRLGMILTSYIACVLAAWYCDKRAYSMAKCTFLLLAAFIYGAGIFLTAEMFNCYERWDIGVGWWIVGLIPTLFLIGDVAQLSLVQGLSLIYLFSQDILADLFSSENHALLELFPPIHIVALAVVLWLAWVSCSRTGNKNRISERPVDAYYVNFVVNVLLTLLIFASRLGLCFSTSTTLLILSLTGVALSQGSLVAYKSVVSSDAAKSMDNISLSVLAVQALQDLNTIGVLLAELCALPLTFAEVWYRSFLLDFLSPTTLSVVATVIIGIAFLWRLHRGQTSAGVFFVLLLCRWFFDDLLSFMSRAVGFTSVGIVLVIVGLALERRRHRGKKS